MHRLAKLGFTQSYTYFTWRNTKQELTEYFTELTQTPSREYFRPNVWPNTPDILHEYAAARRPAGVHRAAGARRDAGRELRHLRAGVRAAGARAARARQRGVPRLGEVRDASAGTSSAPTACAPLIARLNAIRRDNPALQRDWSLRVPRRSTTTQLLVLLEDESGDNVILVAVNLDPQHPQSGWVELDLDAPRARAARDLRGARPADRRALHLERPAQLRRARPARSCRRTSSGACASA